jgi:Zn-dependent protease with chaperone function
MGEVEERGLGTIEWIFSASLRMPRATIAALATAWTGIILALWVGAVSAIGSVVITAFGLTASGHFAGVLDFTSKTSGGIVFLSALIAAVVGFGTGFSATYASSLFASVSVAGAALFIGIVIGMVFGLIGTVMEPRLLAWRGYRRPSEREWNDHLTNALQTVVDNMKLRTTPRLLIMDTPIPQAWTYSRTIVLSKGLLEGLDRGELAGVLAHEMVHWRRGDGLALRMVWCFGWPVGVLYNIGMFLSGARFPSPSGGASGGGTGAGEIPNVSGQSVVKGAVTFLTFFGWMILWPTWLLTKFFVVPMTAANSRTIEYEADAGADAAELGGGLARALAQLSAFEIPRWRPADGVKADERGFLI